MTQEKWKNPKIAQVWGLDEDTKQIVIPIKSLAG